MKNLLRCLAPVFFLATALSSFAGPVNINAADAETLSNELSGIGLAKAQAIVEYRKAHGPFESAQDLLNVSGIVARTLEMNKEFILLGPVTAERK